ncbi:hypothetical protein ACFX2I_012713 [Malus domestica]
MGTNGTRDGNAQPSDFSSVAMISDGAPIHTPMHVNSPMQSAPVNSPVNADAVGNTSNATSSGLNEQAAQLAQAIIDSVVTVEFDGLAQCVLNEPLLLESCHVTNDDCIKSPNKDEILDENIVQVLTNWHDMIENEHRRNALISESIWQLEILTINSWTENGGGDVNGNSMTHFLSKSPKKILKKK